MVGEKWLLPLRHCCNPALCYAHLFESQAGKKCTGYDEQKIEVSYKPPKPDIYPFFIPNFKERIGFPTFFNIRIIAQNSKFLHTFFLEKQYLNSLKSRFEIFNQGVLGVKE